MRFLGSELVVNGLLVTGDGIAGTQANPSATTLSDGRIAVTYETDTSLNLNDPAYVVLNPDGSRSSIWVNAYPEAGLQTQPMVAAIPGGGFGLVFRNDQHADGTNDVAPANITYLQFSATGAGSTALAIGDIATNLLNPAIATLSSGRQVVVYESAFSSTDHDVYLNVVNVAGTATQFGAGGDPILTDGNWESNPSVAAIGNKVLVVYEFAPSSDSSETGILAGFFDGNTNTFGAPFTITPNNNLNPLLDPKVGVIDDHRYLITYHDNTTIYGKIYDTTGAGSLSNEFVIGTKTANINPAVSIAATQDGGFIVTWFSRPDPLSSYDIFARRFNSDGAAMGNAFIVNQQTAFDQTRPTVAVSGVNAFFAWTDDAGDGSGTGVRGQMMTLTTPPDFNDNGISDVLWRNDNGSLALWDMSNGGAIAGSGFLTSGGTMVAPGASWSVAAVSDFTGDARADILWRNDNGSLAEWQLKGSTIISSFVPTAGGVSTSPDSTWHTQAKPTDFA